ncbi:amidohydrolase [Paenalkalicoccus suaedae]|uniref:5-methylthioadenosine/S-adenosylhomocysteine deaminase n=1 Tax=Paenalkalicoccus suaedae TaxID=2592382 RepID=A0A859FFY9_9BACI|nr:amidohydrolase [Paenalkalicoccus suaedae]QKS71125.1 amidohydrolase [Paenalkalicoccus suaedae]
METLIHNVTIYGEEAPFYGYMTIKDDTIQSIGKGDVSREMMKGALKIDGKGKWLIPGLINTHGHIGSSFLRGAGDDLPLQTWLQTVMWPNEAKFDRETVLAAAELSMIEMIRSGTTTFLDFYHLAMPDVAELILDRGVKGVLGRGMIGLCSKEEQDQKLQDSLSLYDTYHGADNGRVSVVLAPHAPYTCPPDFLKRIADAANNRGILLHTHCAESYKEVEDSYKEFGMHPIKQLESIGFFEQPALLAHVVHASEEELEILSKNDVRVSHNLISNLKLGSGIAPLPAMLEKGITVGLGTDSTASNNTLDLFEELRMTALVHKGVAMDPTKITANQAFKLATSEGAKAVGLSDTGVIKEGYKADFVLIDPNKPHLFPNERMHSHLVYAVKSTDVTDVFIHGKQVMKDQQLTTIDQEKVLADCRNQLSKLM